MKFKFICFFVFTFFVSIYQANAYFISIPGCGHFNRGGGNTIHVRCMSGGGTCFGVDQGINSSTGANQWYVDIGNCGGHYFRFWLIEFPMIDESGDEVVLSGEYTHEE